MNSFLQLAQEIQNCHLCPRLRRHCINIARVKRAAYQQWDYWGKPVTGFGDENAKIWIIGLAPGAHGANRTGRVFTGDKSGEWLYRALYQQGWSNSAASQDREDSLQLQHVYISCVVRCAPPQNRPLPKELDLCFPFLEQEWNLLKHPKLVICLGKIAFEQMKILLQKYAQLANKPRWKFSHGAIFSLGDTQVLASYHPSQQNTQTGRLTPKMWTDIFKKASSLVKTPSPD